MGKADKRYVYIKRQPGDHQIGQVLFEDLRNIKWDCISGGVHSRSGQDVLYGYIYCTQINGKIGHSCLHGSAPHDIKVFIPMCENDKNIVKELKAIADRNSTRHSTKKAFNLADRVRKIVIQNPGILPANICTHIENISKKEIDNAIRYLKKTNFKTKPGIIGVKYKSTQKLYVKPCIQLNE